MTRASKIKIGGLAVAVILLIAGWGAGHQPHPIEGVWKNDFYGVCLCQSKNFYLFKDGKIVSYSDGHFTDYDAGRYEDLGDGRFRVILKHNSSPDSDWIVSPGKDSWRHPPDENAGFKQWRARQFYRPKNDSDEMDLVASAKVRDARLKGAIEKHKTNKARKSP
jgi:hypothetical protein